MLEQEVGSGGTVPTLTSIFIYRRFPERILYREQTWTRERRSHQRCQHFSVPEDSGKSILWAQSDENEVGNWEFLFLFQCGLTRKNLHVLSVHHVT